MSEEVKEQQKTEPQLPSGLTSAIMMYGNKNQKPAEPVKKEEPAKVEPEKKEPEVKTEPKKEPTEIKTPLMTVKVEPEEEVKEPTEFFTQIKEKTGYEFKTADELFEKLNKAKDLESIEDLMKDNVHNKQIREVVEKIPDKLRALLVAFETGENYEELAKTLFVEGIDFSKDVEKIDDFKLVSHYNPKIKSKEKFDEMDEEAKEIIISAAKESFKKDQYQLSLQEDKNKTARKTYAEKALESIEKSVAKMKKDFPNLTTSQIKEIEARLHTDPTYDLIDKKAGLYKEDAASRLAWSLYGQQTMDGILKVKQAEVNKKIEDETKKRASEELEQIARAKGEKVERKVADTKDVSKDVLEQLKVNMSRIYGGTNQFINSKRE